MLKRHVLLALCLVVLVATGAGAQPPAPQEKPAPTPTPAAAPSPAPMPPPPRVFGQPVTVRIDLTVTDQIGSATPVKKVMTMIAADGERASVRATNRSVGRNAAQFNIDAKPMLVQDKIRLDLSIYYDPPEVPVPAGEKQPEWSTTLQESMGLIVGNGVPTIVSQSADPRTDRKVTVEVKATILK